MSTSGVTAILWVRWRQPSGYREASGGNRGIDTVADFAWGLVRRAGPTRQSAAPALLLPAATDQ